MKPEGGSFSYDCRSLNSGPDAPYDLTTSESVMNAAYDNKYLIGGAVVVIGIILVMRSKK